MDFLTKNSLVLKHYIKILKENKSLKDVDNATAAKFEKYEVLKPEVITNLVDLVGTLATSNDFSDAIRLTSATNVNFINGMTKMKDVATKFNTRIDEISKDGTTSYINVAAYRQASQLIKLDERVLDSSVNNEAVRDIVKYIKSLTSFFIKNGGKVMTGQPADMNSCLVTVHKFLNTLTHIYSTLVHNCISITGIYFEANKNMAPKTSDAEDEDTHSSNDDASDIPTNNGTSGDKLALA